jgi:hypothetical protein
MTISHHNCCNLDDICRCIHIDSQSLELTIATRLVQWSYYCDVFNTMVHSAFRFRLWAPTLWTFTHIHDVYASVFACTYHSHPQRAHRCK